MQATDLATGGMEDIKQSLIFAKNKQLSSFCVIILCQCVTYLYFFVDEGKKISGKIKPLVTITKCTCSSSIPESRGWTGGAIIILPLLFLFNYNVALLRARL